MPAQSRVPVPEVPLAGGLCQPGPAASPACAEGFGSLSLGIASRRAARAGCGAAPSRAGSAARGSDPVWQLRVPVTLAQMAELRLWRAGGAFCSVPGTGARCLGREGGGMCPPCARSSVPWPAGTGEGSQQRAGADSRGESSTGAPGEGGVGPLLLQAVMGSVVLTGMGGRCRVGSLGLGEEGERRREREGEGAWPRRWLCSREGKSSGWGLALSKAWVHPENWRIKDEACCGGG